MKTTLKIFLFFVSGILLSYFKVLPKFLTQNNFTEIILYILLFFVGLSIGGDEKAIKILKKTNIRIIIIPVIVIIGSVFGAGVISFIIKEISFKEGMAVGSGFGYYSLSSIIIKEVHSEALGTLALLSNIFREMFTIISAPILVRIFGKLGPVVSGGATSMDSSLPAIVKSSGKEYAPAALFSGIILTILVPFIVSFILKL